MWLKTTTVVGLLIGTVLFLYLITRQGVDDLMAMLMVAGWGLAAWLFPGLGLWLALLVGAALAPTDAALGTPVVTNPAEAPPADPTRRRCCPASASTCRRSIWVRMPIPGRWRW